MKIRQMLRKKIRLEEQFYGDYACISAILTIVVTIVSAYIHYRIDIAKQNILITHIIMLLIVQLIHYIKFERNIEIQVDLLLKTGKYTKRDSNKRNIVYLKKLKLQNEKNIVKLKFFNLISLGTIGSSIIYILNILNYSSRTNTLVGITVLLSIVISNIIIKYIISRQSLKNNCCICLYMKNSIIDEKNKKIKSI